MTSGDRSRYRDRTDAGRVLAAALQSRLPGRVDGTELLVLGLPRGGLPVAVPVAAALHARWGALGVRKLGVPGRPELAMGALADVGGRIELVRNEQVLTRSGVDQDAFVAVVAAETAELARRTARWGQRYPTEGQTVIVVDDGLATGSTMRAAVTALRRTGPAGVLVAVPVGSRQALDLLAEDADDVVCPWVPSRFVAVGMYYRDFSQVSDAEVERLLAASPP